MQLAGALSGDPFGAPLPHDWFQPAVATMPATAYLLPVGSVVSGATVSTRGNNYTADDDSMRQLLSDAGLDTVADLFPSVGKLRYDGSPPLLQHYSCFCVIIAVTQVPPLQVLRSRVSLVYPHQLPSRCITMLTPSPRVALLLRLSSAWAMAMEL